MKKGQVTTFIIISLLMLFIFSSVYLFLSHQIKKESPEEKAEPIFDPFKTYLEECLKTTLEEGIIVISQKGGYYQPNKSKEIINYRPLTYLFYLGEDLSPSKEKIEKDLARFVDDKLNKCLNFSIFEKQGFSIKEKSPESKSVIAPNKVYLTTNYPINIKKGNLEKQFSSFAIELNYNFKEKIDFVRRLMEKQKENKEYLPLGFLLDLASQNNFTFELLYFNDSTVGLNLFFNDSEYFQPLIYSFAFYYPEEEAGEEEKEILLIDSWPTEFEVYQGESFSHQVSSWGKGEFFDFADFFDITKDGLIEFVVDLEPGKHEAVIGLSKGELIDYEILTFIVK